MRSSARGGASPAAAGRRPPGTRRWPRRLGRAQPAAASPGIRTRTRGPPAAGQEAGQGLLPLTMVKTRCSTFLQKLGLSGAGHQYERLERGELETSVSVDDRARSVGPDRASSAPHAPIPSAWRAPPARPPPPGAGEKRLHSNAGSRVCSGPALLQLNRILRMRN